VIWFDAAAFGEFGALHRVEDVEAELREVVDRDAGRRCERREARGASGPGLIRRTHLVAEREVRLGQLEDRHRRIDGQTHGARQRLDVDGHAVAVVEERRPERRAEFGGEDCAPGQARVVHGAVLEPVTE